MEYTKLCDGVYEISPSLEPFTLVAGYDASQGKKIASCTKQIQDFLSSKFPRNWACGWGPHSSDLDNTGSATYHIDGYFKTEDTNFNFDYMLLCALSNNPKNGTYLRLINQDIGTTARIKRILTKPWTPYLIRGNIPHRGRPIKFDVRACLRWYFNSEGKLK